MRVSYPSSRACLKKLAAFLGCIWLVAFGRLQSQENELNLQHVPTLALPVGIKEVPIPLDNPLTHRKIELGRLLFFERRLSENETLSCASCHVPERAFSDSVAVSRGPHGPAGKRNTPTLVNVALQPYQFWDGRSASLEDQALRPLENSQEMGSLIETILSRLNRVPSYRKSFQDVFGSPATRANLAQALASFERTILSGNSPYDRYLAGEKTALHARAIEGMNLFSGKAHCHLCHQGQNLSDGLFHNLGVSWNGKRFIDAGRFGVTGIPQDKGAFKTPTLRQIAQTAPYMHDGSLATLEAVVEFYDRGGNSNPHLDALIQPRRLSVVEKEALLEFLRSLTGEVRYY